ncbi:MAG: gliding motility-associated C-terminal domain-containing protein [Bacteroidaceae bacterium]|nr:gliding motility-associated C-terminal domain-containing protein [Bacteroidaceae bacterium]
MKKYLVIFTALCCMVSVVSCNDDDEGTVGMMDSNAQATREGGETTSDDPVTTDEMGASPIVRFYSIDEGDSVSVNPGESQTAQAPLKIELSANISNPDEYEYICEWRIWRTSDSGSENNPLVTRFEENTDYTLTRSGGYGVKLYITFSLDGDTIEYESETMTVVISESKLICPDGFSPNNDGINDSLRITAQSIVELEAKIFNRWGQKIHSVTLATAKRVEDEPNKLILWDGKVDGKFVKNGSYPLHLKALGSDGIKYEFRKNIAVMTGFREGEETGGGS